MVVSRLDRWPDAGYEMKDLREVLGTVSRGFGFFADR